MRKSGSLDFYYDFKLVEAFEAKPEEKYCIAIDSDFTDLHYKLFEKSEDLASKDKISEDKECKYPKVVWYTCRTSWKQRVGISSS